MCKSDRKKVIITDKAPRAIGPYSVGIQTDCFVFTSGQLGLNPITGEIVSGGIEAETRQVIINLKNILEAVDSSLDSIVKTTVFLKDMNDFTRMNTVYGEFFSKNPPARTTVAVKDLPKGALIEIDAVAMNTTGHSDQVDIA
jgi:2-iminobutanoate/2-iminopropanoate deaminase